MSDEAQFDPRFDPAFQRGYSGPAPTSAPRRQPARAPRTGTPPEPIGLPPQNAPTQHAATHYTTDRPAQQAAPVSEILQASSANSAPREDSPEIDELEPLVRRANPFLLLLSGLGVLFVLAGVALLANLDALVTEASNGMSQSLFYLAQVIMYGAPMIIALGLATLVGVLFVVAVRWRR